MDIEHNIKNHTDALKDLNVSVKTLRACYLTLTQVLIDKGVVTNEDFSKMLNAFTEKVDDIESFERQMKQIRLDKESKEG